jgi:hypothetical protein
MEIFLTIALLPFALALSAGLIEMFLVRCRQNRKPRKLSARQRHERNDKIVDCLLSSLAVTIPLAGMLAYRLTHLPL